MLSSLLFSIYSALLLAPGAAEQIPLESPAARFPWIRKYASIGDSYSAGIGAGSRIDWSCSRYTKSYPNILHNWHLGHDERRTHQFLSCSGATSSMILADQVPRLTKDTDLLTISAGGNDVGLTPVLSNCIYQFYMASEDDCEKSMQEARALIDDPTQLYQNVTTLVRAAKLKMNQKHGIIIVTGYAGFFGVEDDVCDNVTWAVWDNIEQKKQYLKLDLRQALDDMVRDVNAVLYRVTQDEGPNVRFVNYDAQIAAARGRYCEAGVVEPAPNREELAFYEWSTVDVGENKTELRDRTGEDVPRGSFEGGIANEINKTLQEHPDWEFDPEKGFINKTRGSEDEVGEKGPIDDTIHWLLPDSWKRVFHLRPEGHEIVARLVVEDLVENGMGVPVSVGEVEEL